MKSIKVRFNLSRGQNYMKWKVQYPSGTVEYCDPCNTQLVMKNCTLKNSRKTAEKIFGGEHKTVCAWILCDEINIRSDSFEQYDIDNAERRIRYNPKVSPYWVNIKETNLDGYQFTEIGTVDYKLFVTKF